MPTSTRQARLDVIEPERYADAPRNREASMGIDMLTKLTVGVGAAGVKAERRVQIIRATIIFVALAACGCALGGSYATTYLVKPGTSDPVHVVRCDYPAIGVLSPLAHHECVKARIALGYVEAPEPECAYYRDDARPGEEIKIRDSCKHNPPEWAKKPSAWYVEWSSGFTKRWRNAVTGEGQLCTPNGCEKGY